MRQQLEVLLKGYRLGLEGMRGRAEKMEIGPDV